MPQQVQEWDKYGKPITQGTTGAVQEWDATGKPVTALDAQGTKGGGGAPQPTSAQLGADPLSSHAGGMAREAALGFTSGFSGAPETMTPLQDMYKGMKAIGEQDAQHPIMSGLKAGTVGPAMQAYGTAKGLYGAGKEMVTANEPEGFAHGAGDFVGQLLQLSSLMKSGDKTITPEASAAARLLERHNAVNQGQVKVVNGMVRNPIQMLEAKVSDEIGRHANAVIAADDLHNKITNNPAGYVDAVEAVGNAVKKSEQIGGDFAPKVGKLIEKAQVGPMTMKDAKALTTEVGRAGSAEARAGNARGAAVLAELYDGLHKATASRADDLGAAYAKSWQHYITETSSLKDLQSGVMGKLMAEPNHAKALDHLINPDNAAGVREIVAKMKQYNVDPEPLQKGQEMASDLSRLSQETKNAFIGKIRGIIKYPVRVGAAAAGAAVLGHLSGVPGMGFVLPLLVAGKVAGMLDQNAIKKVLAEINKTVPPEQGIIHKPGEGPMPTPPPPVASGISAPPEKGATAGEADDMADLQQAQEESTAAKAKKVRSVFRGRR